MSSESETRWGLRGGTAAVSPNRRWRRGKKKTPLRSLPSCFTVQRWDSNATWICFVLVGRMWRLLSQGFLVEDALGDAETCFLSTQQHTGTHIQEQIASLRCRSAANPELKWIGLTLLGQKPGPVQASPRFKLVIRMSLCGQWSLPLLWLHRALPCLQWRALLKAQPTYCTKTRAIFENNLEKVGLQGRVLVHLICLSYNKTTWFWLLWRVCDAVVNTECCAVKIVGRPTVYLTVCPKIMRLCKPCAKKPPLKNKKCVGDKELLMKYLISIDEMAQNCLLCFQQEDECFRRDSIIAADFSAEISPPRSLQLKNIHNVH